jgi:hypothetical protein
MDNMIQAPYALAAQDDWCEAAAKRTHRTVETTPVVLEAVKRAEMGPEQASLNELLK